MNNQHTTLWKSLYVFLKAGLQNDTWPPGSALPSSRDLAASRGISRSTVVAVYDQLQAEGLLESRRGSGTFAAHTKPVKPIQPPGTEARTSSVGFGRLDPDCIDFRSGLPDLQVFPMVRWHQAQRLAEDRFGPSLLC